MPYCSTLFSFIPLFFFIFYFFLSSSRFPCANGRCPFLKSTYIVDLLYSGRLAAGRVFKHSYDYESQ
ncbi:hypothetical protein BDV38DRAFT_247611 [Aspergillus pseudotamarii]|uniref:Uncharacterized protein n=1 Tax=Aspergillus pseudotamarii TaxID=132259 RepID=A0A5N6SRJ7_ASPPS|nr:uncharacterized protein BDV38DRAFT_247611 [Aspergillus pseudotamarii]KAE8137232.1 hypothetical protein BDV38DRAFT_247611 [Aspergillus pseudotamarii]